MGGITSGAATLVAAPSARISAAHPLVGAIRWDAWYAPKSSETAAVARTLSKPEYSWRAPFFAEVSSSYSVMFPEPSQAEMDAEIRLASHAGLDFWAFVSYPETSPMSRALALYLTSPIRDDVRFCIFSQLVSWGRAGAAGVERERHIAMMACPSYVRIAGRPLYYLGFVTHQAVAERWGAADALATEVASFRTRARTAGMGDPFLVVAGVLTEAGAMALALGADAVGSYSIADGRAAGAFSRLSDFDKRGWDELACCGLPVVPTVMTGWDRRPRVTTPVPWEHGQAPGAGMEYGYGLPSSPELSGLLKAALSYRNPKVSGPPPAVLIYAWNENDEGGWLIPTVGCHAERLEAVRRVLRPGSRPTEALCPGSTASRTPETRPAVP